MVIEYGHMVLKSNHLLLSNNIYIMLGKRLLHSITIKLYEKYSKFTK
jgi:hypothetical protein